VELNVNDNQTVSSIIIPSGI